MRRIVGREAIFRWLLAALFVMMFVVGVNYYGNMLRQNEAWVRALGDYPETRLVERSFELISNRLLDPPLLRIENLGNSGIELELESCEARANATGDRRVALELLCNSPYGERIRDDVEGWNAAHHLLAVRDNRSKNGDCENAQAAQIESNEIYLPAGCKPPHWRISRPLKGGAFSSVRLAPSAAPPENEYAVVLAGDPESEYQSDWATADGGRDESAPYVLQGEGFPLASRAPVTIEAAARVHAVHVRYLVNGASKQLNLETSADSATATGDADGLHVALRRYCADSPEPLPEAADDALGKSSADAADADADFGPGVCPREPPIGAGVPLAYDVTLSFVGAAKARSARVESGQKAKFLQIDNVSLDVSPVILPLEAIAAAPVRDYNEQLAEQKKVDDEEAARTGRPKRQGGSSDDLNEPQPKSDFGAEHIGHLSAKCPLDPGRWSRECGLTWTTQELRRGGTPQARIDVRLFDAPQTQLVDPGTARISQRAFDLGLTDVLGLEKSDYGAMIWALARNGGGEAKLSISEPMQQAVEDVLTGGDAGCARSGKGLRGDRLCAKLQATRNTATIVLMDADQAPGEIRAIASWPSLPKHRNIWDLRGLEETRKADSGLAWRQLLPGQRPGSTFKAVTAVAAIEAATNQKDTFPFTDKTRQDLSLLLGGAMPFSGASGTNQVDFLGLGAASGKDCEFGGTRPNAVVGPRGSGRYRWCVHNAGGAVYDDEAEPPGPSGCPVRSTDLSGKRMSLCEATKRSSNLYFGGLARLVTKTDPARPTLALEDIARRLSFSPEPCPNSRNDEPNRCGFDLTRGLLGKRTPLRLRADPIVFDRHSGPDAMKSERDMVLSGFGDAQSATPLAMTTVYASLASGRLVRPSILALPRDKQGCPLNPAGDECQAALPKTPEFDDLFALVRDGMHAVVANLYGTAYKRFRSPKSIIDRVFAKTGTATYRGRANPVDPESEVLELSALWLVGWIEGDGSSGPLGHRLVFGCHVSGGRPKQYGADFCAPAISDLLLELSQNVTR